MIAGDLLNIWGGFGTGEGCGVDALYRKAGDAALDGAEVRVYLSETPPRTIRPMAPKGEPAKTTGKRWYLQCLMMDPAATADEAAGVGSAGIADSDALGVRELKRGDTFEVRGAAIGKPGTDAVILAVGSNFQTVSGVAWAAEVMA